MTKKCETGNESQDWQARYFDLIKKVAENTSEFTAEDIRVSRLNKIGNPPKPQIVAPVFRQAIKLAIIKPSERFRKSTNGNVQPIYRSLIFRKTQ